MERTKGSVKMKNTIRYVQQEEIEQVRQYFKEKGDKGLLVELWGEELRNWEQYSIKIGQLLQFPEMYQYPPRSHVFDAYLDWMEDLSWFKEVEEFAIIINGYDSSFLSYDKSSKKMIVETFVTSVLPWWEYNVERCSVGGKAKPFNVYLVD